ncbi:unnamed protein product [Pylaiella littoralis]
MARLKWPESCGGGGGGGGKGVSAASSELSTTHEEKTSQQGIAPSHSKHFAPLTRPASFSFSSSSGGTTNNNSNINRNGIPPLYPPRQQSWTAGRGRSGSYDDNAITTNYNIRFQFGAISTTATTHGDRDAASENSEGFPVLLRRRTFTEPTRTKSRCTTFVDGGEGARKNGGDRGGGGGGSSGRVPMSEGEDAVSQPRTPPQTPTATLTNRGSNSSISISSSGGVSSGDEDSSGSRHCNGVGVQDQHHQHHQQPWRPTGSSIELARRNAFVMRLHRAGLVEGLSRCVMNIVEGRAAAEAAPAAVTGREGVFSSRLAVATPPVVTLEEVKEHLRSLPERYALSVDPEDVVGNMTLVSLVVSAAAAAAATAADSSSSAPPNATTAAHGGRVCVAPTVRVLARPSRSPLEPAAAAVPRRPGLPAAERAATPPGNSGVDGGGGGNKRERYTVTVACLQSPLLLEAVSSSLRSVGVTCLDADVVKTTAIAKHCPGVSLARLEVEVVDGGEIGVPGCPARAAAAAAAAAAGVLPSRHQPPPLPREKDAAAPLLADTLSSATAAAILAAEKEGEEQAEGKDEMEESGHSCSVGGRVGGGGVVGACGGDRSDLVTAQATAVPAAAAAEEHGTRRKEGTNYDKTTAATATAAPGVVAATVGSSRHPSRPGNRREPLARRQGCFFLAEADANALGSNGNSDAFSFGGGSGGSVGNGNGDAKLLSSSGNGNNNGGGTFLNNRGDGNDGSRNNADGYATIPHEDVELLELVGKGRFSRTYRAMWRGATVAVKTLELPPPVAEWGREDGQAVNNGSDRSVIVAEFERELHIVRKLRHPNVCGFRGVCTSSPPLHHLSLVYDFLANGTLGDRLLRDAGGSGSGSGCAAANGDGDGVGGGGGGADGGESGRRRRLQEPLRSAGLVRIVKDVVDGMLYLHEVGVLHRDVKPDNILLDAGDRAVIADFGLSRFCQPTNEHTAETGTYRWMAPEVIRHEPYSQAADVYSFGVVLWQVLTRRQPFEGLTPIQAAFSVARQGLRPQLPPSAPPALSSLVRRCWHRNPDARPSFPQIRSELPEIERQMLLSR